MKHTRVTGRISTTVAWVSGHSIAPEQCPIQPICLYSNTARPVMIDYQSKQR